MKLTIRKFMLQHCTHEITVCRNLLRTEDKMGNWSSFASSARTRLNNMFKE